MADAKTLRTPWTSSSGAIMNADGRLVCYPISGDTDDHDRAIAAAIVKAVNEAYACGYCGDPSGPCEPPGCDVAHLRGVSRSVCPKCFVACVRVEDAELSEALRQGQRDVEAIVNPRGKTVKRFGVLDTKTRAVEWFADESEAWSRVGDGKAMVRK